MPLDHYGVLAGTLTSHVRDTPDDQGRWFHLNLKLSAPLGSYRCAVDVDSKASAVGVRWKLLTLPAVSRAPGFHDLASTPTSGALDHIRHPALTVKGDDWQVGSFLEASEALESILVIGRRTLVWGEPFEEGLGVHNIHQNQGDPLTSQWADENGIWQDGAVMVERKDGRLDAFISKFSSQASKTDDEGHPA